VPLESILFYVKGPKTGDKVVEVTIGMRKGYDLLERYLIKVEKKLTAQLCHTLKDTTLYVDFKNIDLPW
jgi:hypothetical protein